MTNFTMRPFGFGLAGWIMFVASMSCPISTRADTFTITGTITQSTGDGTGPAVNNPQLNGILDGSIFNLNLDFTRSIQSFGTFDLSGSNAQFSVASAGVTETDFNSVSLTVAQSGALAQFSILACLLTGSACNEGNELVLNFTIPAASTNDLNVATQGIAGLLPLDLLEDDGVTDIQGIITDYSHVSANPVPEPAAPVLVGTVLLAVGLIRRTKNRPS